MQLWSLSFDEMNLNNFPQICYKNNAITIEQENMLVLEIFKIFYLTNNNQKEKIKIIESNHMALPYESLFNMIYPPKQVEFHTEYLIDLLNLFCVELETFK